MGFLRQEYWSGFPFHPARNLPDPEINQGLQVDSSPSEPPMKPELDDSYMYCRKNSKKYNSSTTHDENMKKNFLSVFQNVSFAECVSVGGGVGLYQSFSLVIGCLLDLRKLGGFQASFQTEHLWEVLFQVSVLMSLISDFSWSKLNTHTHTHTHTLPSAASCMHRRHRSVSGRGICTDTVSGQPAGPHLLSSHLRWWELSGCWVGRGRIAESTGELLLCSPPNHLILGNRGRGFPGTWDSALQICLSLTPPWGLGWGRAGGKTPRRGWCQGCETLNALSDHLSQGPGFTLTSCQDSCLSWVWAWALSQKVLCDPLPASCTLQPTAGRWLKSRDPEQAFHLNVKIWNSYFLANHCSNNQFIPWSIHMISAHFLVLTWLEPWARRPNSWSSIL